MMQNHEDDNSAAIRHAASARSRNLSNIDRMTKQKHSSQNCCASGPKRASSIALMIFAASLSGCAGLTSGPAGDSQLASVPSLGGYLRTLQQPEAPDQSITYPPPTSDSVSASLEASSVRLDGSLPSEDEPPVNERYVVRQYPDSYAAPSNFSAPAAGASTPYNNPYNTPNSGYTQPRIPTQVVSPSARKFTPSMGPPLPAGTSVVVPTSPTGPNNYQQPQQFAPNQAQYQQQVPSQQQYGGVPVPPPSSGVDYVPNTTPFSAQAAIQPQRVQSRQFPEGQLQQGQFPPGQFQQGQNGFSGQGTAFPPVGTGSIYTPTLREADLIINGFPARTGRIMFGGAVNSDAGVTGQITVDERNFDIRRFPRSFSDLFSGQAFRGAGETFRLEAAPGSEFDRYTINWATPNLFNYLPFSFSVGGFLYDRRFEDWDENRLGGRLGLGYRITPNLSLNLGISGQKVRFDSNQTTTQEIVDVLGRNSAGDFTTGKHEMYSGSISLKHDTRDSPIQASVGHYLEFSFEETFGDFDYSRFELEYRKYWLLTSRADDSGKQTLSFSTKVGYSGDETPIFENFFAGGYATIRGFDFRGASPVSESGTGVQVGGRFQWLNTAEYMFPITADDAFRGVAFVDFGTVERTSAIKSENYRVAPGLGVRVAIPALGPAPLAFDYAVPVARADGDERRSFSFYMSLVR